MDNTTIILLAAPLIIIQLVLMVINLLNLYKKKKTKYLNKILWLVIIFLGNLIGNIIYIVVESDKNASDQD